MSPNDETASGVERDEPTTDSVYDFLYHDARRIGSFLGQMDVSGHLTGLKQIEAAESASNIKGSVNASASVAVARGGVAFDGQNTTSERESFERTYDPLWTNALALLDMLDERNLIQDGLAAARIGQFVKVTGALGVTDLTLWKGLWEMPALKQVLIEGATGQGSEPVSHPNRQQRRQQGTAKPVAPVKSVLEQQAEAGLSLVNLLPHTIQARIASDDGLVAWCSLQESGLIISASDLTLKHGVVVSGTWTMVGVLDALPDLNADGTATGAMIEAHVQAQSLGTSPFGELMQHLTPAIRVLLGRPVHAYGMTPLVIFREISG